jgi:hypothetical protein
MPILEWRPELPMGSGLDGVAWKHAGSNICLDFHGDPAKADLVVFSDGNHHMALEESLQAFARQTQGLKGIFYATTPPGVLVQALEAGKLYVGNLCLSLVPHLFISPPDIFQRLIAGGFVTAHQPFVRSQGNVLLIRKGNPKSILGIRDLTREDVRLFISNPDTEAPSHKVYRDTLHNLAQDNGVDLRFLDSAPNDRIVYGERIHHREAPQSLADGQADAAVIYYHLALRYTRIFPDLFEFIPLGGTPDAPNPAIGNVISQIDIGLVGGGGERGQALLEFLSGETVTRIYDHHGLRRP